jgi:hypothetical protein
LSGGIPVGPLVSTAVSVAAANVLIAYLVARAVDARLPVDLGGLGLAVLGLLAACAAIIAVMGWRAYLRRRRA